MWQLGENTEIAPVWRYSIPFRGETNDFEGDKFDSRRSVGNLTEEEINGLVEVVQCDHALL